MKYANIGTEKQKCKYSNVNIRVLQDRHTVSEIEILRQYELVQTNNGAW
jgi:hypothetical protein